MTPLELQRILDKAGFKSERVRTGHPDCTRTFIKKDGVTYGRASFQNGELYGIKWYLGSCHIGFNVFCVEMLMQHNYLPTEQEYNLTWYWAEKAAKAEYDKKITLRKTLPDKKRKSIQAPNPAKWFRRIFEYKWIIFRGIV
jgi:hypothetical protein